MKLPALAIKYSQFTLIVFILLTLSGIISYITMPKSEDPFVEFRSSFVRVINPGASAEEMEVLINNPIEEALNEIEGIETISSTISDGAIFLWAEYEYGEDYDALHREMVQKINEIRNDLPPTVYDIGISQPSVLDVAIMQLALTGSDISPNQLRLTAERMEERLERISGIRGVDVVADQELQLQVKCDFDRLAYHNIKLSDVLAILESENRSIPGGSIDLGEKKFNVKTSGMYQSPEEIGNTVIQASPGKIVKLRDIATVEFDYKTDDTYARLNGEEAVWVTVKQKKDQNIYTLTDEILSALDAFESQMSPGIELHKVMVQKESVETRINSFIGSLLQGLVLVGAIILLAMGGMSSLIVMLVIPICILAGLGILDASGFGLQQMTIAGMIISLGMLVDNSIAVVENIYRYLQKGFTPVEAAVKGAGEISTALMSSTLTTLLAFMPMLMLGNEVGDFIRSMILIIIYTLSASLLAALFLTPFISSRLLKRKKTKKSVLGKGNQWIMKHYDRWLRSAIRKPALTISIALIIFIGSASLMPFIGVSFFPKAEKEQILIYVRTPEGSSLASTDKAIRYVENKLREYPEIADIASTVGESNPQVYYNMMVKNPAANLGSIYVMVEGDYSSEKMETLIHILREDFADYTKARVEVKEFAQGPPVNAPVEIRIFGDDLEELKRIAAEAEVLFRSTPGIININNPFGASKNDLRIAINRNKAGMLGVPTAEIDRTVRAVVHGIDVGNYTDNLGDRYDILLKSTTDEDVLTRLQKSLVPSMSGSQVKMQQVSDVVFDTGYKQITHYNNKRYVALTADVDEKVASISEATEAVTRKLDEAGWPGNTYYEVGGEEESRNESFGGLGQALLIALLAIFGVLVLQFKSFKQPLIIFSAIPLSITGAFLGLFLSGYSFSFMAFVGLTSLMGVVINASIIQVDYANQLRTRGMELREAIVEAAKTRFNPIMLTTITTVGGLLPLTLSGGDMWGPMGWAIIGGLLVSTTLTLILVPVLYTLLSTKKEETSDEVQLESV